MLLDRAEHVNWSHLKPHFYIYPTFFIYQQALVRAMLVPFGAEDHLLLGARVLTLLYGAATILLLYLLGARLGGRRAGLLAAGLYAVHGASVQHAHYAVTDTPMTTLVTAAAWLSVRAWQRGSFPGLAGAAAVAGLAMSTKYSAAPVVYVPLLATFALAARKRWAPAPSGASALTVLAVAFAFLFIASPYLILDYQAAFADLTQERELQVTARGGYHDAPLLEAAFADLGVVANARAILDDLGPPVAVAALGGMVMGLVGFLRPRRRNPAGKREPDPAPSAGAPEAGGDPAGGRRWDTFGWAILLPWPILYFVATAPSALGGQRYMLPIYPALILFAAASLERLLRRWAPDEAAGPRDRLATAILFILLGGWPAAETVRVSMVLGRTDTRLVAREWILENLAPTTVIAREQYSPPLRTSDGYKLVQFFSLTDQSFAVYCNLGVDYMLTSSQNAQRYFEDEPDRFVDERGWYRDLERHTRLVRRFEGAELSFHQPTIEVRQLYCPSGS